MATSKQRTLVISRHGTYRFQTGMVTAELLSRGVDMEMAFPLARKVRDLVSHRKKISTDDLDAHIQDVLDKAGWEPPEDDAASSLHASLSRNPLLDRALLSGDFNATSLSPTQISDLLDEVVEDMARRSLDPQHDAALYSTIDRLLLERGGPVAVRRYRLCRWVRTADRPVIIFIGGATGTGKSTLATELAFRLGIRLVSSTDLIRETMRAVLSPEVTPGLHAHSFRGLLEGGAVLSDPRERVLAGFHQQAAQVAVGIRAVVRRAVREGKHLIIEGTHLLPPFQRYLPPGAAVHPTGFLMTVPEEAQHLARFPRRARSERLRDAAPYLDAFQSVRWIHDDLLGLAEDAEAVVLASGPIDQTTNSCLEFLGQMLSQQDENRWMGVGLPQAVHKPKGIRTLFLILDGLGDEPIKSLGKKTPLGAAHAPTLRRLAGHGGQGLIRTREPDGSPGQTDSAMWRLLGAGDPIPQVGRGMLEALGRGVPIPTGSVVFRGNLATLNSEGDLLDRRAGRIRVGLMELLAGLRDVRLSGGLRASIVPGHEHRVIVVISGQGLSDRVADTDPGRADPSPRPLQARSLDDSPEAARTAEALRELLATAQAVLGAHPLNRQRIAAGLPPANCIITRGAASAASLSGGRPERTGAALVASCTTALGVARAMGMQAVTDVRMTGNLDTDLNLKLDTAAALLEEWPSVVVHFKGTDVAAHDRDPEAKRDFIARFDAALGELLTSRPDVARDLRIVVTGDHGTSSKTGDHLPDDVPLLLATWSDDAEPSDFDENSAERGALGLLTMPELTDLIWAS